MPTALRPTLFRPDRLLRRQLATTPSRLWGTLVGCWVASICFFFAVDLSVGLHRQGMKTIGVDAAPSIIAAQGIKADLAAMHASVVRELLSKPGTDPGSFELFTAKRKELTDRLLDAAANITYGDEERKPIRALLQLLGDYLALIGQARALHELGNFGFAEKVHEADQLLRVKILPASAELDLANRSHLEQTFASNYRSTVLVDGLLVLAGLALLATLAGTHEYLRRRTRRYLHPALIAAAGLTVLFLLTTLGTFWAEASDLRLAKKDAFDSIDALGQARALGFDAVADERLALLDPVRSAAYWERFEQKSEMLLHLPPALRRQQLLDAVKPANGSVPPGVTGKLADELRNITFPDERPAAVATLTAFIDYVAVVDDIRGLEQPRQHAEAVALLVSTKPDSPDHAFGQFSAGLEQTIAINQQAFDAAVARGSRLDGYGWWNALVSVLVAGLSFVGLWPRIREYAA